MNENKEICVKLRIGTLRELALAVENKRSVVDRDPRTATYWVRPMPAAIVMNMPGTVILDKLNRGLYLYPKKKKVKPYQKKEKKTNE